MRIIEVASIQFHLYLMYNQKMHRCYLQPLAIGGDLRDLIVDPVDEVCIACRQEAILRGKENTDKRVSDCSVYQNHQKGKK